jgi:acetoin utilization protein AcuA
LGTLSIRNHFPLGFFTDLKLDSGIGNFAHYSSIIRKPETFEEVVRGKDGRLALAVVDDRIVVGYATCWYPVAGERWSRLGELMYEMGAIEVSRNFRKLGIARRMMKAILSEDFFEDKITYMNGYSWHWDLDGSGLTVARYRQMLMRLLDGYGFRVHYTNELNVALRDENVFMARIGSRVLPEGEKAFRNLRFGIAASSSHEVRQRSDQREFEMEGVSRN